MDEAGVRDAMRAVIAPELDGNIVDPGLVYGVTVHEGIIGIAFTRTTPVCPLHAHLTAEIESVLGERFPEARSVKVELVWQPPWRPNMMSPALQRMFERSG